MILELKRDILNENNTLGSLFVNGKSFCYTVEDTVRELGKNGEGKVHGKTAIPKGIYIVKITFSNRFKKDMPQLMNVPFFEGVRIHAGNTELDTEGCLIVGMVRTPTGVGRSKEAYNLLMEMLKNEKEIKLIIS